MLILFGNVFVNKENIGTRNTRAVFEMNVPTNVKAILKIVQLYVLLMSFSGGQISLLKTVRP